MPAVSPLIRSAVLALGLLALAAPSPARAQDTGVPGSLQPTRAELEAYLARLESTAGSASYTPGFRKHARDEAAVVRARLQQGDFQIGDQILLQVEGEAGLSAPFTVQSGRILPLPVVGDVPLTGVLRSELDAHLRTQLSRFIRDPVVRSRSMVRVAITGQVRQPGFYVVASEALVSDALMAAGGPLPGARLTAMRVERGGEAIWEGEALQQAIVEGRTLDQMSLRAGDNLVVPGPSAGSSSNMLRMATAVPGAILAILGIIRIL